MDFVMYLTILCHIEFICEFKTSINLILCPTIRVPIREDPNRFSSYFSVLACTASQDACFTALFIHPEERKKQRCYAYSTSTFPLMVHTAAVPQLYNSEDSEIRTEPVPVAVGGSSLLYLPRATTRVAVHSK
jgi:hypothetical protein